MQMPKCRCSKRFKAIVAQTPHQYLSFICRACAVVCKFGVARDALRQNTRPMNAELASAFVLLFLVLDPLGNLPVVSPMLKGIPSPRRAKVVVRECFLAYLILIAFMFFGRQFLDVMHLSEISLSIAGGVILFMISIRMVFPSAGHKESDAMVREPLLVPLAIPLIAGPSALATVMLMVSREPSKLGLWIGALSAAMLVTTVILALGDRIEKLLGRRGMEAVERLMGLILTAIAIEMLLGGLKQFLLQLK